jgi:hypothetical protein
MDPSDEVLASILGVYNPQFDKGRGGSGLLTATQNGMVFFDYHGPTGYRFESISYRNVWAFRRRKRMHREKFKMLATPDRSNLEGSSARRAGMPGAASCGPQRCSSSPTTDPNYYSSSMHNAAGQEQLTRTL